jgi:hypothetical protein
VVGYGQPLVEALVEEIRATPACAQVYINGVRPDKRGLLALARQALILPNARLAEMPRQSETVAACHYVRFNFRAALITDEKEEQLVSVVMDAQAGLDVPELRHLERLAQLEDEPPPGPHLPAPVRWLPGQVPLSQPVLAGLLDRATGAALRELAPALEGLGRRAARYLELDRARLNEYYDGISRDLERRLNRAGEEQRRAALEDKLAATRAERKAKLADVEAKYRPHVDLELINLEVIHQPKVLLTVQIANRTTTVERTIAWDPLLHRIEPLACDVCGRAGTRLMLCAGGHLAHEECLLAEQCVDCKRVYCRLCAGLMGECVVCDRPVCTASLVKCGTCGRGTCREHAGLCHAAAGAPARVAPTVTPAAPEPPPAAPKRERATPPERSAARARAKQAGRRQTRTGAPPPWASGWPALLPVRPVPAEIEVFVEPDKPVVTAIVLTKEAKRVAVRSWELTQDGVLISCRCEKGGLCMADGVMLDAALGAGIEAQLRAEIARLRQEYQLSARQVAYYRMVEGARRQVPRLELTDKWKGQRESLA